MTAPPTRTLAPRAVAPVEPATAAEGAARAAEPSAQPSRVSTEPWLPADAECSAPAAAAPTPRPLRGVLLAALAAAVLLPASLWLASTTLWPASTDAAARAGTLLLAVLQAAAVCAVAYVLVARRWVEPLERLAERAHALAAGRGTRMHTHTYTHSHAHAHTHPPEWARCAELAPMAQALDGVHRRIAALEVEVCAHESQLQKAAMYDALTALPNRALMAEIFEHEAAAARRAGRTLALVDLGIDRLRALADLLGRGTADEALTALAHRLQAFLSDHDFVCRDGDERFLVLLPERHSWDDVAQAVERLLREVERPLVLARAGREVSTSAWAGVAMYPADGGDFEALARAAGVALDRSRSLGRGSHSFYQPALDAALRQRLAREADVLLAFEHQQFRLFFQPIFAAERGALLGCEVLLRWAHPTRGLLAPPSFLADVRQAGLMCELDAWVMQQACAAFARWRTAGLEPGRLALNLSVQQARNPALSDVLQAALAHNGLHAAQIELEVTEDAFATGHDRAVQALARWRALGLVLTVDDFGTGYTSLQTLKTLRPERLKIDCSLVRHLPEDADDGALAQALLAMARALQIDVVAEGVETAAQRDWLLAHGCVQQQGHLHGSPMPAAAFEQWLAARQGRAVAALPSGAGSD